MNRQHYSFHTSDWGTLSATVGDTAHFTADDEVPTVPAALMDDGTPVPVRSATGSKAPLRTIARKPAMRLELAPKALYVDDLQWVWVAPHRRAQPAESRPTPAERARPFADGKWSNLAIAVTLVAACLFMALALPRF